MANTQMGLPFLGFSNSLKAAADMGGSAAGLGTPANYGSVANLRTRLAAINGAYYTSAMLDIMSVNDMIYALRMSDDKTTISNYQP